MIDKNGMDDGFRVPTGEDLKNEQWFNIPAEEAFKIPSDSEQIEKVYKQSEEMAATQYGKKLDELTADELRALRDQIVAENNKNVPKSRH